MRSASLIIAGKIISSFILCFCLTMVAVAQAEPRSNATPSPDDVAQQLLQRLQELEADLKQFKTHLAAPSPTQVQASALVPAAVLVPAPTPVFATAPGMATSPAGDTSPAHDANVTEVAGRLNAPPAPVRYDFEADRTYRLQYDPVSGAICMMRAR